MSSLKLQDAKREEGFTLIELLVVVLIIGILAAIAIPVFLSQRERAWESEVISAVRNVALEIEAEAVRFGGDYTSVTGLTDATTLNTLAEETLGGSFGTLLDGEMTFAAPLRNTTRFCISATHPQLTAPDDSVAFLSWDGGVQAIPSACPAALP
jgi:type IV pilus assembly protein PilA